MAFFSSFWLFVRRRAAAESAGSQFSAAGATSVACVYVNLSSSFLLFFSVLPLLLSLSPGGERTAASCIKKKKVVDAGETKLCGDVRGMEGDWRKDSTEAFREGFEK